MFLYFYVNFKVLQRYCKVISFFLMGNPGANVSRGYPLPVTSANCSRGQSILFGKGWESIGTCWWICAINKFARNSPIRYSLNTCNKLARGLPVTPDTFDRGLAYYHEIGQLFLQYLWRKLISKLNTKEQRIGGLSPKYALSIHTFMSPSHISWGPVSSKKIW